MGDVLTAVCSEPIPEAARKMFRKFNLLTIDTQGENYGPTANLHRA